MTLAERVTAHAAHRREARRADPVTMEEFGYLLGRGQYGAGKSKAGVAVGPMAALGNTGWYRGCRYLSEQVSGLPYHVYGMLGLDKIRRADPPWLSRPDEEMPWLALVEHWMMSLLHRGNAYAYKIRNPVGQVVGLRGVHPDRVKVGRAKDGTKVFQIDNGEIGFTRREIVHIPGLSYNGVLGLDPMTILAGPIGLSIAADEFAAKSFGQGSHLQAYLSIPQELTEEQAETLKAQWEKFHKGMANSHEFGVLGNGATYQTVSLTPEQQQLLDTRKFQITEMARVIGCPPHKLYDLERATFSNIEHQGIEAATDSVVPWVRRIEAFVNLHPDLVLDHKLEATAEGLMRGDSAAETAALTGAVQGGWMTPQHAARIKNLPAPDELNYYQRPLNVDVIREGQEPSEGEAEQARKLAVPEVLQKLYLAVGPVITTEEARQIANEAGANLTGPGPQEGA